MEVQTGVAKKIKLSFFLTECQPTFKIRLQVYTKRFDVMGTVHRDIFLEEKPKKTQISQIYFWNRTLHVSDSFSVHHQESSTVHTAIGICHTGYADCLLKPMSCTNFSNLFLE